MIVVFNGLAWSFEHVPFDAALLGAMLAAFPTEEIHFFGERHHIAQTRDYLRARVDDHRVGYEAVDIPPRGSRLRTRAIKDFKVCARVIQRSQELGARFVVASYVHAVSGTLAIKALSTFSSGPHSMLIHHGNILRLFASRRYHPLLSFSTRRITQVVLAESIRQEVIQGLPSLSSSLAAIRHPYLFEERSISRFPTDGVVTFSFLGLLEDSKGFPAFAALAETFGPTNPHSRFDLIGGTRVGPVNNLSPWVQVYSSDGPMTREAFSQRLRQTTYAVFPYEPMHYRLIASGSVLDAVMEGKPIIALRNSQFQEMFDAMGDIGYLCDSVEEMKAVISSILADAPADRYFDQSRNILEGRDLFSPKAVGEQLRELVDAHPR